MSPPASLGADVLVRLAGRVGTPALPGGRRLQGKGTGLNGEPVTMARRALKRGESPQGWDIMEDKLIKSHWGTSGHIWAQYRVAAMNEEWRIENEELGEEAGGVCCPLYVV